MLELDLHDKILIGVIGFIILWILAFIPFAIHYDNVRAKEHAEMCASRGMSDGLVSESSGKYSISRYFCYDKDGRVYYFE